MARMTLKNLWGSPQSGIDQQRSDLFWVMLNLPSALQGGDDNGWEEHISWAIESFPFPNREVSAVAVKYMQQTNFQIGGDGDSGSVEITARYAFNQKTFTVLERWFRMVSDPRTGSVALSSQIKTMGKFYWLIPNMEAIKSNIDNETNAPVMKLGGSYVLEGAWIKGLKTSDADMKTKDGLVTATVSLQIDRYYPEKTTDLWINTGAGIVENYRTTLPTAQNATAFPTNR